MKRVAWQILGEMDPQVAERLGMQDFRLQNGQVRLRAALSMPPLGDEGLGPPNLVSGFHVVDLCLTSHSTGRRTQLRLVLYYSQA